MKQVTSIIIVLVVITLAIGLTIVVNVNDWMHCLDPSPGPYQ